MTKDQIFKSIDTLRDMIVSKLELVASGRCALGEMDALLADIRELEERIIVIRYKSMERISLAGKQAEGKKRTREISEVREPELPLNLEASNEVEEPETKQISLIDSIEEISQEVSVNENHIDSGGRSLAEKLEAKPIESIVKALSINQKMGLVDQVFKGDDTLFVSTIDKMDSSENLEKAIHVMSDALPEGVDHENVLLVELKELVERRFQ